MIVLLPIEKGIQLVYCARGEREKEKERQTDRQTERKMEVTLTPKIGNRKEIVREASSR